MFPHFDQSEYAVALQNAYRQFPAKDSTLDIDFINNRNRVAGVQGAALDGVTFTRSTTATYFGSDGLLKTAAVNEPRFEYDPVSRRPLGLLIEESRANLLTYSEQFDNGALGKNNASVTPNTTVAPDGTTTADKLVEDLTNNLHFVQNAVSVTTQTYTISVYAKSAERTQFILGLGDTVFAESVLYNLSTASASVFGGSPTGITIQPVGSGWYRCSFTKTASGSGTAAIRVFTASAGAISYQGDGTSGLYIWGAQLEAGAFATSYIPTTSTSVTRGADVASMTGANFSSWWRNDEFSVFAEFVSNNTGTSRIVSFLGVGGDSVDDIPMFVFPATGKLVSTNVFSGGVNTGRIDCQTVYAIGTNTKTAVQYSPNQRTIFANGDSGNSSSASFTQPPITYLMIGSRNFGDYLNGHMRRIIYNPKLLPKNLQQYLSRPNA